MSNDWGVPNFSMVEYLEPDEARAIIEAIPSVSEHVERDQLLLELLWQSGARISEAVILIPERIGMTSIILTNLKQDDKNATKEVEVSKELCDMLRDYCSKNHIQRGDWVFKAARNKKHLSRWMAWWIVNKASEAAGIFKFGKKNPKTGGRFKGTYPHAFRHGNAMKLLEETGDISIVKEQLGHASIMTSQGYAHVKKPKIKEEVSKIKW